MPHYRTNLLPESWQATRQTFTIKNAYRKSKYLRFRSP